MLYLSFPIDLNFLDLLNDRAVIFAQRAMTQDIIPARARPFSVLAFWRYRVRFFSLYITLNDVLRDTARVFVLEQTSELPMGGHHDDGPPHIRCHANILSMIYDKISILGKIYYTCSRCQLEYGQKRVQSTAQALRADRATQSYKVKV